ncbi:MAG: TIGR01777 family protein [Sphingobacteriales bacterium]|nr:MAG: TIGR01777 family protein [Sphingobacteriales bacterium]
MKNIVIAGGSGLIGKNLSEMLLAEGYSVTILSRKNRKSEVANLNYAVWDPEKKLLPENEIKDANAVINLAGTNIASKRWTNTFKEEIIRSRTESTRLLVDFYNKNETKLPVFINASAVGYYGADRKEKLHENDSTGNDFIAKVCKAWENEATRIERSKLVIFRIGIVLAKEDGALPELAKPIKLGFGAALGSGKQGFSWVHIHDLCKMLLWAIENPQVKGVYNAVAPQVVSNATITKAIAKKLHKSLLLPNVPGFALKILLGEFAEALLGNSNVSSNKITGEGFRFTYPTLLKALDNLYE